MKWKNSGAGLLGTLALTSFCIAALTPALSAVATAAPAPSLRIQSGSDEPRLPPGLGAPPAEPALPSGLEPNEGDEPALPAGLDEPAASDKEPETNGENDAPFRTTGFWEARGGVRLREVENERRTSLGETRLQVELEKQVPGYLFHLTTDLVYDSLADRQEVDLETGEGFIDLREANVVVSPAANVDIKAGRQILTWGTGDLLFINDLFPKDFVSFFIGRDEAYLKAPSDALKVSYFSSWANLDVVYTPRFDADRFIDGSRLSFFDAAQGRIVGRNAVVRVERPDDWFEDDEWALRLYSNFGAYELALYGYDGFWKSPAGFDPITGRATFPRLSVYGVSLRGPVGPGIANIEFGRYDSRDDPTGDDPLIRNGEARFLVGYEQELARNFTLGAQYYLERMFDYEAYRETLPPGVPPRDELRRLITARVTWLTLNQNLAWSLFVFYSQSDEDSYARPKVHYKVDDHWSTELGGNLFNGKKEHTFFSQFRDNDNVYAALRYGF